MRTVKFEQVGSRTDVVVYAQGLRSRVGALLPDVDPGKAKASVAGLNLSTRAMQAAGATDKSAKTRMRVALICEALDGLLASPRGGARPGAGRPRTGTTTEAASFRAPKCELAVYRRKARAAGISLSAWVRETLRA